MQKNRKKHSKNQVADFTTTAPDPRNDQKLTKKRITQSRFAQFLYRHGIFWTVRDEYSFPRGSEYVWHRGGEGVLGRVTGGRS